MRSGLRRGSLRRPSGELPHHLVRANRDRRANRSRRGLTFSLMRCAPNTARAAHEATPSSTPRSCFSPALMASIFWRTRRLPGSLGSPKDVRICRRTSFPRTMAAITVVGAERCGRDARAHPGTRPARRDSPSFFLNVTRVAFAMASNHLTRLFQDVAAERLHVLLAIPGTAAFAQQGACITPRGWDRFGRAVRRAQGLGYRERFCS